MRIDKKIKKKILKHVDNSPLRAPEQPPILACYLYHKLLIEGGKVYNISSTLIECLMIASLCEGLLVYQITQRAGLYPKNGWIAFKKLIDSGYVYKGDKGRIYLTTAGKEIVNDVNRLWANMVIVANRKESAVKVKEPPKVKRKYVKKVKQFEPFTLGTME